ncbi:hypothetical protein LUZ60_006772 [Juncus effusus]|nr:hypothetical protein LUZ60_006772 [Juncus effusus]
MASCSLSPLSSSPSLKPLNLHSSHSQTFFSVRPTSSRFRTSLAVIPPANESRLWDPKVVEETKKKVLEKYGDFSEFMDKEKLSPKKKRGKKKKESVISEEEKPPRTTHKLLQVLGGKAKRRKLLSPAGMDVRPMMQVVRAASFAILQAATGTPAALRPGRWLDLYSGTGSVGIEAISRGCTEAHFVEMDPWVVSEVLKPNLQATGFLDISSIHMKRVESYLDYAETFPDRVEMFDYISVTPPYLEVDYGILMDLIARSPLVGEDTFVVVEYPLKTEMSETCGNLVQIVDRRFGRTNLLIYGPEWAQKKKKKSGKEKKEMKSQILHQEETGK